MSPPTPQADDWIRERLHCLGVEPLPGRPVMWRDTTNYMSIERDHLVDLGGDLYLIRCNEREGRFGLDEQPKLWVKRAIDLRTGQTHILKLVIQERFKVSIGPMEILCVRSAEKERKVPDLVHGDPRFMQGHSTWDARGNLVRVIDFIRGTDLLTYLDSVRVPHEEYSHALLPGILAKVADNIAALQRLHQEGLCHGDIRNDHLIVERETGCYKWIDFDLDEGAPVFDIWSIGNILHCVVAKGFMTFRDAISARPELSGKLSEDDGSAFFPHRVMNLRKIYPYLPEKLNAVLLRFSIGARACYERVSQITGDLAECATSLGRPTNEK